MECIVPALAIPIEVDGCVIELGSLYADLARVPDKRHALVTVLVYSPSLVTVQAVTIGEFPGSTGRTFNPLGLVIDNTTGSATFGASSLGSSPAGPTGTGTLAYVRLLPQAAGTALLQLSAAQASDVSGSNLPLIKQEGLLSIVNCLGDFNNRASTRPSTTAPAS